MNKEGRGFNPAVADASNYSPVLRPAQSRACGTPRGARRTEVSKPFCGGVNPPLPIARLKTAERGEKSGLADPQFIRFL
jgi:hypothetical protein